MKETIMRKISGPAIKKAAAGVLAGVFLSAGTLSALAASGDLTPVDISIAVNTGTGESTEVEVFWCDEWFEEPSTVYNHELATTSIGFSNAAYLVRSGEDPHDTDMYKAFSAFSFDEESIAFYNYDYPYTLEDNDVVAYTFAAKKTDDFPIVAIIVRGTANSLEWDSNLRVSADDGDYENVLEHYGFYESERKLASDLDAYIAALAAEDTAYASDDLRLYMAGHSRGGAVVDILASEFDNVLGKDRVYAYTFAAPAVSAVASEAGYENIFNILSADDHVSELPSVSLDFKRFGVEKTIASSGEYESRNDDIFAEHEPFVYFARMKSGLPDTLFE